MGTCRVRAVPTKALARLPVKLFLKMPTILVEAHPKSLGFLHLSCVTMIASEQAVLLHGTENSKEKMYALLLSRLTSVNYFCAVLNIRMHSGISSLPTT